MPTMPPDFDPASVKWHSAPEDSSTGKPEYAFLGDGRVVLRNEGETDPGKIMVMSRAMWDDFVERAQAGELDV